MPACVRLSRRAVLGVVVATAVSGLPALAHATGHPSPVSRVRVGDVVATVGAGSVQLGNAETERSWSIAGGGVTTTALVGPDGRDWVGAASPDFTVAVDGIPTSSRTGWRLAAVHPRKVTDGVALDFRYAPVAALVSKVGVTLDRVVTLHDSTSVFEVDNNLVNDSGAVLRVGNYRLDQVGVAAPLTGPAFADAYHGGSDWRDDYRARSRATGSFDREGEVLRLADARGAGVFFVSERRGGVLSRVGRDGSQHAWVGVEPARDLFDFGPLRTDPPDYNRLDNPAYPVPVRQRTVLPKTTLHLGTAFTGTYVGGDGGAAAAFLGDFTAYAAPHYPHTVGLNTFHPWSHGPDMSDLNLRKQVDAAAALGVESFMLDDQWQGGKGGESGDWRFDPARFPDSNGDGVPDFVDYLHAKGLRLGLWMSPVEFNGASTTYKDHPRWACAPTGDATAHVPDDAGLGVWDVTNPGFRRHLTNVINRLVAADGVTEFKFDFQAWVDCAPHDYLDYEDAFVSLVLGFERRHPGVTFELDETNDQRAWPFESAAIGPSWFDNGHLHGSTAVAKLLHDLWTAAPWMPVSSIGTGAYDDTLDKGWTPEFLMPLALLGHTTFWTDLTKLTPDQASATRWWIDWFTAHRDGIGPVTYEDSLADPLDGSSWLALQPMHGADGYLFAFNQSSISGTRTIALHGLTPGATYDVRDVRTNEDLGAFTAAELSSGLPVSLGARSAQVLSLTTDGG